MSAAWAFATRRWPFTEQGVAMLSSVIHLEQAWADNRFTAEGNALHQEAHDGHDSSRPGVRITRSLPVVSRRLGLAGQCDIVEFHANGTVVQVE